MTPAELKHELNARGSHFFDRDTMKFFGDTMRDFGCRSAAITTTQGETVDCWRLYRKQRSGEWFFKKSDFTEVWQ